MTSAWNAPDLAGVLSHTLSRLNLCCALLRWHSASYVTALPYPVRSWPETSKAAVDQSPHPRPPWPRARPVGQLQHPANALPLIRMGERATDRKVRAHLPGQGRCLWIGAGRAAARLLIGCAESGVVGRVDASDPGGCVGWVAAWGGCLGWARCGLAEGQVGV